MPKLEKILEQFVGSIEHIPSQLQLIDLVDVSILKAHLSWTFCYHLSINQRFDQIIKDLKG